MTVTKWVFRPASGDDIETQGQSEPHTKKGQSNGRLRKVIALVSTENVFRFTSVDANLRLCNNLWCLDCFRSDWKLYFLLVNRFVALCYA